MVYLHSDQLGSVRVVTDHEVDDGSMLAKETVYHPFGETVDFITSLDPLETKGFIPLSGFDFIKTLPRRGASGLIWTRACST